MKKLRLPKVNLSVIALLFVLFSNAQQISNYSSVRNTGVSYTSVNILGTAFNNWRNITSFTQDDNRSDFTDIGFDFWYNGTRYTQFCVSTNGFIDFSSSTDDGGPTADDFGFDNAAFTNNNLSSSTNPAIAPFYDDLTAQGGVDPLGTSIKYYLSGSAPNRTLTIEWINMAVYLNTTPSLNFQVQLVESNGKILINYGTMNTGTQTFSYSMGLNSGTISATPTAAQLKMLQTVNTNTLNNTIQNSLSGMPSANSQYIFTPPIPANPTGSITFNSVTQSGMTLNWTNWAANEVGYVIYNSTDGVNFSFVTQTASNITSSAVSGLMPSTTYYWRLYAVTEGCLSSALTGTQATSAAGTKTSIVTSGNWNTATTWSPTGVPTSGDNVIIANGHSITINTNAVCNSLRIGTTATSTLQFGNNTARSMTVFGSMTVSTNSSFSVASNSNANHSITFYGDITNNGNINFATDNNSTCDASFVRNGSQTISGTGTTNKFNLMTVNMGSSANNILEISSTTFTAPTNFLTLTNGTFKYSVVNATNITPFTGASTISQSEGLWLNSANAVMGLNAGLTLTGKVTVSNGTLNIGDAADEDLLSSGGTFSITGGRATIAGKYYATGINNLCYFTISGGTLTVPGNGSTNTTNAPFQIAGAGSWFNMTGGVIVIPREGGGGTQDLGFVNTGGTSGTVSGGTLQIGNTTSPASQTININSGVSIPNLVVSSGSVTAKLATNLNVLNNVTISSGTLHSNNLGLTLGGNWVNSGVFTSGTGTVTFNSGSAQSILKSGGETFNHLTFSGSGVKTFSAPITANGNFSISSGSNVDISTSNYSLSLKGNFTNNGTFNARTGLVHLSGTTSQTVNGSTATNFNDITLGNTAGAVVGSAQNLLGVLTLTAGTFNSNSFLTMVSTATATARIAQITGSGDITGNVIVQRFTPGGTTGWALFGTPISSALTLNDWDDDIYISCPGCPDLSANGFQSIYTYNEAAPGQYDAAASYIPLGSINDPITPNKGYWVYLGDGQYTTNDITVDVTGTVRKFNNSIPLSRTNFGSAADDGWNLIHNPYPSPIRWSLLRAANTNVDDAIYVYNADLNAGTGGFATYINGVSSPAIASGGIGDIIPMSQGFYVHATAATTLTAQESNKVAGNPTYLKANSSTPSSILRLTLDGPYTFNDESVLYIQQGANDSFDNGFDAYKMRGQDIYAPSIALQNGTDVFQVNGVAPITGNFSMPLKVLTGYPDTYTISASNFSTFPSGACINLYDKFTGTTTNLKNANYVFNLSDTTTVARFDLNITINPLNINSNVSQPSCQIPNQGQIIVQGANSGPWNYYWTSNGNVVKTSLNKTTADTLSNLSNGNFDLEINTVGMCDNNYSNYVINEQVLPVAQFTTNGVVDLNQSQYGIFANNSTNATMYFWSFGDGVGTSTSQNPIYYYNAPGIYTVSLLCWSFSGCSSLATQTIEVTGLAVGISPNSLNSNGLVVKTVDNNDYLIEQNFNSTESVSFRLMDASGRLIKDFGTINSTNVSLSVNLNQYAQGIYFLSMTNKENTKVIKLPVK